MADNLLVVRGLKQYYPVKGGLGKEPSYVKAVDNVDFEVRRGEVFGIVGESGCGKSVTSLSIMQLLKDTPGKVTNGSAALDGVNLVDISNMVGYEDQSYFSKVFKKLSGVTPGKFRETRGKNAKG